MGRLDVSMKLERGKRRKKQDYDDWSEDSSQPDDDQFVQNDLRPSPGNVNTPDNDDDASENMSDDHVTEIYKDYDLYLSARNGNLDDFKRLLEVSPGDVLSRLSPAGNTYLHVAAKHGRGDVVAYLSAKEPSLALLRNSNGETALHVAARGGNASIVRALVLVHRDLLLLGCEDNVVRARNGRGDTALDVALINGRDSVAEYLIREDPEVLYGRNNAGESALYLAARGGFANCVSLILEVASDEERVKEMFGAKSPIAAAIQGKHRDVLEAMFRKKPSLIELRDDRGRTPLHYAASFGHLDDARYLLKKCADNATERDRSGSFPIHLASKEGHIEAVRFLLQEFPDPAELLDREGRNVLHLAAKNGRSNIVEFVLKNPDLAELINMRDGQGNTALHLASMFRHPKIVHALTWDGRVDVKVSNDEGMSALDAAEHHTSYSPQFFERLTWAALKAAGTPRYHSGKTALRKPSPDPDPDIFKERVNTLLLVATLVATVTFAAGFTMPGGYNSSPDKNPGAATKLSDKGFHVFVFCDTMAMYTSIVVAVALIWAQLSDLALVLNALTLAQPLLGVALSMMSMAFTAGLFVVISELRWLATAVLVMGGAFVVVLFLLFLPLCSQLTSRNRVLRYLSYYPFCLLTLASSR